MLYSNSYRFANKSTWRLTRRRTLVQSYGAFRPASSLGLRSLGIVQYAPFSPGNVSHGIRAWCGVGPPESLPANDGAWRGDDWLDHFSRQRRRRSCVAAGCGVDRPLPCGARLCSGRGGLRYLDAGHARFRPAGDSVTGFSSRWNVFYGSSGRCCSLLHAQRRDRTPHRTVRRLLSAGNFRDGAQRRRRGSPGAFRFQQNLPRRRWGCDSHWWWPPR